MGMAVDQSILDANDLVFFTNGSLTQNATMGGHHNRRAIRPNHTKSWLLYPLGETRGARSQIRQPRSFHLRYRQVELDDILPDHNRGSYIFRVHGEEDRLQGWHGRRVTIVDSSWKIGFVLYGKDIPNQPDDVNVFWAYGQCSEAVGDHIKKPMRECTGAEMFAELLYHCGLEAKIGLILEHTKVSTSMTPYITSQFMPRKIDDRPKVIPEGCVNLAFIGQFVELPGDVVFTVETSVRTAMMAVWGLTSLDKPMIPIFEPVYDLRVIMESMRATLAIKEDLSPPCRQLQCRVRR